MRGEEYYLAEDFPEYLDSPERLRQFDLTEIFEVLGPALERSENILDFGCGTGQFCFRLVDQLPEGHSIFACDSQERMLDIVLKRKVDLGLRTDALTAFHMVKTDRPVFPGWLPRFAFIWTMDCLSTFPDPSLPLIVFQEILTDEGYLLIIDMEKKEAPLGPGEDQKISRDRMEFFIKEAGYQVLKEFDIGHYHYCFLCQLNEELKNKDRITVPTKAQLAINED